jgi:hypothetical protein
LLEFEIYSGAMEKLSFEKFYLWFKNPYKKSAKNKKTQANSCIVFGIVERKKTREENQIKLES